MVNELAKIRKGIITYTQLDNYNHLSKKELSILKSIKEDILTELSFKMKESNNEESTELYLRELYYNLKSRVGISVIVEDIMKIISNYMEVV